MGRVKSRANGDGDVWPIRDESGKVVRYAGSFQADTPRWRKRIYASAKTAKEARRRLAQKKAAAESNGGMVFDAENRTLEQYLEHWLNGPLATRNLKATTTEQYARQVRCHIIPALGHIKLGTLSAEHLQDFYDAKSAEGKSPATVSQLHHILHCSLQHAFKRSMMAHNVAAKTDPPQVRAPEIRPLEAEQVKTLFAGLHSDRLEALYVVAVTAGPRIGELLALRWADCDLERGTLRVTRTLSRAKGWPRFTTPKTGKGRSIELTPRAVEALKRHRLRQNEERLLSGSLWQDNDLIFTSESVPGVPMPEQGVRSHLKRLLAREGLPEITLHGLRHTCATLLLSRSVHSKYVQELLGHSSVALTLDRYSHWIPSMGDHAAKAMEEALG